MLTLPTGQGARITAQNAKSEVIAARITMVTRDCYIVVKVNANTLKKTAPLSLLYLISVYCNKSDDLVLYCSNDNVLIKPNQNLTHVHCMVHCMCMYV